MEFEIIGTVFLSSNSVFAYPESFIFLSHECLRLMRESGAMMTVTWDPLNHILTFSAFYHCTFFYPFLLLNNDFV